MVEPSSNISRFFVFKEIDKPWNCDIILIPMAKLAMISSSEGEDMPCLTEKDGMVTPSCDLGYFYTSNSHIFLHH